MNSNGIIHLIVDAKGALRVYDSAGQAASEKQFSEVQVEIALTKPQMILVFRAEALARSKEEDARQPRRHSGTSASGDGY